ncbi:hypothetical protein HDU83_009639 [Entophlyctis luteolus]|nr:hypothetical protein HDU82_001230 [Entophlyctis luteolus]KAJ3356827.1 hypothetical protein HDU83_009639 [Entophlyctis luteolus]
MLLPPLPLGPFEIGPSEERIAAFLHDKRLHEDDIISVLAMKYTTPEFLELIAETAVSRRWTRVWCLLFPTVQKQLLHLEGRSSNGLYTGEVVEEGVVLVGWGGDSGESPQASSKKLEQEKAVARFPSYLEQHTVADIGRGFVYDSNGDCGNGNLILDAIHAGVNDADNAIVQAAMFDRADMVKWLLFRGIFLPSSAAVANSFNLVSLPGLAAALILAAKHPGTLSTLSLLLMHPLVDPNAHDGSPLAWSCRMGSLSAVKLLIQHGADASLKHGMAGLWAAEHGQTEVVKYLVSKGLIDIHAQEEYGLRWAVARGHIETVRYLCNAGAAVDAMDGFALRHAVQMGHEEIIDILLASGADVLIASRQADVREGVYTSSTARLEENSLVLWALRAGNNSLADKLVASLRASIARSRVCVVDLEE